jgi:hypothetical protein
VAGGAAGDDAADAAVPVADPSPRCAAAPRGGSPAGCFPVLLVRRVARCSTAGRDSFTTLSAPSEPSELVLDAVDMGRVRFFFFFFTFPGVLGPFLISLLQRDPI